MTARPRDPGQTGVTMVTSRMLGAFRGDPTTRREFLAMIGGSSGRRDAAFEG